MEILALWALSAFVGVLIAQSKNRSRDEGCAWGCLLGPIGWLILALMRPKTPTESRDGRTLQKCPHCAEMILEEARVCRYCGRNLNTVAADGLSLEQLHGISEIQRTELEHLEELRRRGRVSEQEYERRKELILSRG